jgi:predicted aspartyl protease
VIYGEFNDGFPRVALELPDSSSGLRTTDFIVDSGFEGDLTLPAEVVVTLDAVYAGEYPFTLADFTFRSRPVYRVLLDWMGEERDVAIVAMDGNALLGVGLLRGNLVQMEMDEGGEVIVGPL